MPHIETEVENPILFETRLEQHAREFMTISSPVANDGVPERDYYGHLITRNDEYMVVGEHYVLIDNMLDYCEQILGFDWCIKK